MSDVPCSHKLYSFSSDQCLLTVSGPMMMSQMLPSFPPKAFRSTAWQAFHYYAFYQAVKIVEEQKI